MKIVDIVEKIRSGKILVLPTDTICGLSGLVEEQIILKISLLKKRSNDKGFILLSSYIEHFMPFMDLDRISEEDFYFLNEVKQEKPTTFLVPAKEELAWLHKGTGKIAVRLTNMPLIYEITTLLNQAIISTSANFSGQKPALDNREVFAYFANNVEYISWHVNDVRSKLNNKPSRIVDLLSREIIRD